MLCDFIVHTRRIAYALCIPRNDSPTPYVTRRASI